RMPPMSHIDEDQIDDILAFLGGGVMPRRPEDAPAVPPPPGPVVASGGAPRGRVTPRAARVDGMQEYPEGVGAPAQRYYTDYGLGHPYLMAPPWSQILAYDLNRGVIKWRKPLGQDLDVAKAGG